MLEIRLAHHSERYLKGCSSLYVLAKHVGPTKSEKSDEINKI